MARCPNCGLETARTKDWACQWCGFPLLSGSYKKIPKTYRELKEERLPQPLVVEEAEPEPTPVVESELEPASESEAELISETEPDTESVSEAVAEPISEPEPAVKPKPKAKRKPAAKSKSAASSTTKSKSTTKYKPVAKPKPAAEAEAKPKPASADIEITVAELFSAYEIDGVAADARFANQILRVTGVVDRIEVKDVLGIYYITLTSAEENLLLQSARCMFDKKDADELNQLTKGQTVTVQGKYDGSLINTRIVDCVLVR